MYNPWEANAREIEEDGGEVNWEERYYICFVCGEPVYDGEWTNKELRDFACPICEWEGD